MMNDNDIELMNEYVDNDEYYHYHREMITVQSHEQYDTLIFKTDRLYNEKSPDYWVSFLIAGIFTIMTIILYTFRVLRYKHAIQQISSLIKTHTKDTTTDNLKQTWEGNRWLRTRAKIAAYIDNDDSFFTVIKYSAQSFWFLGGIQIHYELAFIIMLIVFTIESTLDTIRILIAFWEAESLNTYIPTSNRIQHKTRNVTKLQPTNVYEDLTREKSIVLMVFITQVILISFIVIDIYDGSTHTCIDGTANCPVVGTYGSWLFYILGIFMASVYMLGPKTAFGQSEQNPAYWLKLLLMSKRTGTSVSWYDPIADKVLYRILYKYDWRIWIRFLMSYIVNGIGFHILVHALPIQVAAQSSLTGVVFRAVGMMYLVDLDDTPGYVMSLVENDNKNENNDNNNENKQQKQEQVKQEQNLNNNNNNNNYNNNHTNLTSNNHFLDDIQEVNESDHKTENDDNDEENGGGGCGIEVTNNSFGIIKEQSQVNHTFPISNKDDNDDNRRNNTLTSTTEVNKILNDHDRIAILSQQIIDEAKAKLDELIKTGNVVMTLTNINNNINNNNNMKSKINNNITITDAAAATTAGALLAGTGLAMIPTKQSYDIQPTMEDGDNNNIIMNNNNMVSERPSEYEQSERPSPNDVCNIADTGADVCTDVGADVGTDDAGADAGGEN